MFDLNKTISEANEKMRELNAHEILLIGGQEAVDFYNEIEVTYEVLRDALLSGLRIREIKWIVEDSVTLRKMYSMSIDDAIMLRIELKRMMGRYE